jgi:hypothetical protein
MYRDTVENNSSDINERIITKTRICTHRNWLINKSIHPTSQPSLHRKSIKILMTLLPYKQQTIAYWIETMNLKSDL